jgi:hypothetical protein
MANRARWRLIVAVEPQAAAILQEEVMPINPFTIDVVAKIHRDELERVAEQEQAVRRVLQSASRDRQDQTFSIRLLIWVRRLVSRVSSASVSAETT